MNRSIPLGIPVLIALVLSAGVTILAGCGNDNSTKPDTTAPTVSISSPSPGSVVRDSVLIVATASDDQGLAGVDFYVDDDSVGTDTKKPYQWVWHLEGETFGAHDLKCRARDKASHETMSDEITVTISGVIFTANITSNWWHDGAETGLLFISGTDGSLLAELTWDTSGSYGVTAMQGVTVVPGTIQVTVVTRDASGEHVSVVTSRGVAPATWTWRGREQPPLGTPAPITLNFNNNPNQIGYVVSSPWADQHDFTVGLPNQLDFLLHDNSNDIFVMYGTGQGAGRYKWFTGVTTGSGQYAADLAGATAATKKSITLPSGNSAHAARLYGFPESGNHHAGVYLLSTSGATSSATQAALYFPSGLTDFMSRIGVEAAAGDKYWREIRTGSMTELAASFAVNNGDLDYAHEDPDNFSAAITGDIEQLRTCWQATGGASTYRWFIYSAPDDKTYALPALPASFATLFGDVAIDAFGLQYSELIDYPDLDTYDEVIAETFKGAGYFGDTIDTARLTGFWSSSAEHIQPVAHHNDVRDAFGGER
jgi:hypothetical protein